MRTDSPTYVSFQRMEDLACGTAAFDAIARSHVVRVPPDVRFSLSFQTTVITRGATGILTLHNAKRSARAVRFANPKTNKFTVRNSPSLLD